LFSKLRIQRLFDAPCGDFTWMRTVPLGDVTYIGGDIVQDIIDRLSASDSSERRTFIQFDVVKDQFPRADLWLCRDCFIHLSNEDILKALKNFADSQIRYVLTTNYNFGFVNSDISTGNWRPLNLRRPPFSLPRPIFSFFDYSYPQHPRRLALWSREQVRDVCVMPVRHNFPARRSLVEREHEKAHGARLNDRCGVSPRRALGDLHD
jgi:hypothetical protein